MLGYTESEFVSKTDDVTHTMIRRKTSISVQALNGNGKPFEMEK